MYSLATIRSINEGAARDARSQGKQPVRMDKVEDFGQKPIPHLGCACKSLDRKHRRIETLFVDISGFGSEDEPALSLRQFKEKVRALIAEYGSILLALEERGQFQGYVAVWVA